MKKKQQSSPAMLLILGAVGLALLFIPIMQFKKSQKSLAFEAAELESTIKQQEMFSPVLLTITTEMSKLQGFGKYKPVLIMDLPIPTSFADAAASLQVLVVELGLTGALFIPYSESVVGANAMVRIDGSMEGSLEAFREFILQLSALDWVDRLESTEVTAGAVDPLYKISLWVKVNPK